MELLRQINNTLPQTPILYPKFLRERAPIETQCRVKGKTRGESQLLSQLRERLLYNLYSLLKLDFSGLQTMNRPLLASSRMYAAST